VDQTGIAGCLDSRFVLSLKSVASASEIRRARFRKSSGMFARSVLWTRASVRTEFTGGTQVFEIRELLVAP